jgi:hypothetical protein
MRKFITVLSCVFLLACELKDPNTTHREVATTEANQQALMAAQPLPRLNTSLERKNLIRRLERVNQQNLVSYIYLIGETGRVVAFYTVDGKVTSLNAYLTPESRTDERTNYGVEIELPDLDGAYGKNADGVFFFTTEGGYVEWKGTYLWSDQPLKVTTQPELVELVER